MSSIKYLKTNTIGQQFPSFLYSEAINVIGAH